MKIGASVHYKGLYVGELVKIVHGRAHIHPDPNLTMDQLCDLVSEFQTGNLTFDAPEHSKAPARAHTTNKLKDIHAVVAQLHKE